MPLALTDDQLQIIRRAAAPLHPHDRSAFLERVARALSDIEAGDGVVARAARDAQQHFMRGWRVNGGKYR
jgi:DNA-directed RNA polymerase specialized sigma24 family protein